MFGLIIGLLVFCWSAFISGAAYESAFHSALGFLWGWYLLWAILKAIVIGLPALGVTLGGAAAGGHAGGKLGALLGLAGGGAIGSMFGLLLLRNVFLLGGVFLLSTSGNPAGSFAEYDTVRMVFGGILLVIGLFMGKSRVKISFKSSGQR